MNTVIKNLSILLCMVATIVSCHRKPIDDFCTCSNTLEIPIDVDWTTSGVTPQNVTVLFYNSSDGSLAYEHAYEHNSKDIQSYAFLGEGSYTAVIFNELRDQIDYVSCVGYDNLSTLKFESNDDDPARARSTTRAYIEQPGDLAVAIVENIVVTKDMLSLATKSIVDDLLDVSPKKKNNTLKITAHFKNLFYARMPALVDLVNLADGYFVNDDQNSSTTSTLQFTMNNREYYDEYKMDDYISTTVTTFGTLIDRTSTSGHSESTPVILDVLFKLIDEYWTETSEGAYKMDVTSLITHEPQSDGSVAMTLEVWFPDKLPEVVPEGSSGDSSFGSDVEDWEIIKVPLTQ